MIWKCWMVVFKLLLLFLLQVNAISLADKVESITVIQQLLWCPKYPVDEDVLVMELGQHKNKAGGNLYLVWQRMQLQGHHEVDKLIWKVCCRRAQSFPPSHRVWISASWVKKDEWNGASTLKCNGCKEESFLIVSGHYQGTSDYQTSSRWYLCRVVTLTVVHWAARWTSLTGISNEWLSCHSGPCLKLQLLVIGCWLGLALDDFLWRWCSKSCWLNRALTFQPLSEMVPDRIHRSTTIEYVD